jgi:hypothetical protein
MSLRGRKVGNARKQIPSCIVGRPASHRLAESAVWEEFGTGRGELARSTSFQ